METKVQDLTCDVIGHLAYNNRPSIKDDHKLTISQIMPLMVKVGEVMIVCMMFRP